MKTFPLHLPALFTALILAAPDISAQKTVVVPKDFRSIQKALNSIEAGDTVFVANGIYRESIELKDECVLIGQDWEKTVIHGNGKKPVVSGADKAVIKNLTLENGKNGVLCQNNSTTIEHTLIRNNKGSGVHCLLSLPLIRNNIIAQNDGNGILCESVHGLNTAIEHNIIVENHKNGISLEGRTQVLIQNNILLRNNEYGLYVGPDSKKSRITFNNIFNNRQPFNREALIDNTNISKDPQLVPSADGSYVFLSPEGNPLKGLGKSNMDIGIMSEEALHKLASDNDNDGITGVNDLCPNDEEDIDGFEDEDGCPDFDNDSDGVADGDDKCPMQPETKNGYQDEDGCPDEKPGK
jgi:OOP family OmpA-OmpF porin